MSTPHYTQLGYETYGEITQHRGNLQPLTTTERMQILNDHCIEFEIVNGQMLTDDYECVIPMHAQNFFAWLGY